MNGDQALTDAWLSEMWPVVRQHREGQPDTFPRRLRKARDARNAPREACPVCGDDLASAYVVQHIIRRHPEAVKKAGDSGEVGAA